MNSNVPTHLAENIKQLREARGLTQERAARVSGVPRPTWATLESGSANPTLAVLIKVAGALQVSIEELIGPPRSTGKLFRAHEIRTRTRGSVVSDRRGDTTGYAIASIQERSALYVPPGVKVYEGMIVGENARSEDMDVNICREKKQTNIRTQSSDDTIRLTPARLFSLEQALETIADDECVEVTPATVRMRKTVLDAGDRARIVKRLKAPPRDA